MAKERKPKHFIKHPTHVGGTAALKKIIRENQRYPKAAAAEEIEGTVVVRYTINHKGKVTGAKVISGIGYGCDEEAKRLVKLLKFEVAKNRGVNIKFHKTLKIHFRKPVEVKKEAEKSPTAQMSLSYTVTPAKKVVGKDGVAKKRGGGSYDYVIEV